MTRERMDGRSTTGGGDSSRMPLPLPEKECVVLERVRLILVVAGLFLEH